MTSAALDKARPGHRGLLVALVTSNRLQLVGFTLLLVLVWEGAVALLNVPPYLLPAPSAIAGSLVDGFRDGLFVKAFFVTLLEAVAGFAVAAVTGVVVGTFIAQFRIVERLIYPYIVALQSVPKVAIAPLVIVWFGYGFSSKIVVSATISFFPVLANVIVGLKSTERDKLDLMRSLDASRWQTLRLVEFPTALPFIFAGLDVAAVFSVLGAIVAEFVGSQAGLGNLLLTFDANLDIPAVFACLFLLGAMGMLLHLVIHELQKRLVFWSKADDGPKL